MKHLQTVTVSSPGAVQRRRGAAARAARTRLVGCGLLALAAACAEDASRRDGTPPNPVLAAVAPPQIQIESLPQRASASDLKWQPAMDYDTDGCYPASAIDAAGNVNPGLKTTGAVNGNCRDAVDLVHDNMYVRTRCNESGWCAHLYDLYFEKDQSVVGSGHTHDWEHIIVWENERLDSARPMHVQVSAHGNYHTLPRDQIQFEGSHAKIVYHKDGGSTHAFRFATAADEPPENHTGSWHYPALVSWNGYPSGPIAWDGRETTVRDKLIAWDFGSATMAIREKPCTPDVLGPVLPPEMLTWSCFRWNLHNAHGDSGGELLPFAFDTGADHVAPGQPHPNDPSDGAGGGTSGQQIAVASYIYPTAGDWSRLIDSPSSKVSVVVANVLNGPDSTVNPDWADVIGRAKSSGKRVLGYVRTGYLGQGAPAFRTRLGSRDLADWIAQIEQDVDMWYALYGDAIGGIFFDEGFNECGAGDQFASIYRLVNRYVKQRYPGALTVINPGIGVPQCYEDTADILLTFESSSAAYATTYLPLDWTPTHPSKIWHIIYDVPEADVGRVAELARQRGAGFIEITDDVLDNPYDTLPRDSYWSTELNTVSGGVPSIAPAADGTGGPPAAPTGLSVLDPSNLDYTSIKLTWAPASGAVLYRVYVDGKHLASLPAPMNRVAIGGLAPGRTYAASVTAEGARWGAESAASNAVPATTLALPHGLAIENVQAASSASNAVYTADFLMPFSFRRVFVLADPSDPDVKCWTINYTLTDYVCVVYMIEDEKFFSYSGEGKGDWTWTWISDAKPDVNGYKYTWTVPLDAARQPKASRDVIVVQGQGYSPLTNVFPRTLVP